MAERLRTGCLDRSTFEASRELTPVRDLSRAHITATRDPVRVQSRLKSPYRSRGIQTPGASVYSPAHRDAREPRLPASARRRATQLDEQVHHFREQKKRIEADLLWESRKHGIVPGSGSDRMQTADGGWIRARARRTRGLPRQDNRVLKETFKGAATLILAQRNKGPLYPRHERMLAGGTKPSLARLTLARTSAATVLRSEDAEADGEVRLAFLACGGNNETTVRNRV